MGHYISTYILVIVIIIIALMIIIIVIMIAAIDICRVDYDVDNGNDVVMIQLVKYIDNINFCSSSEYIVLVYTL